MARDRENSLEKLNNYLTADGEEKASSAKIYNGDRTDVDMDRFAEDVCQPPRKRSCLSLVILLLLAALGIFLFLAWGGKMPWN